MTEAKPYAIPETDRLGSVQESEKACLSFWAAAAEVDRSRQSRTLTGFIKPLRFQSAGRSP